MIHFTFCKCMYRCKYGGGQTDLIGGQTDNQCKNYANCIGEGKGYCIVNVLVL